jgi:RHS repeat-associated protein
VDYFIYESGQVVLQFHEDNPTGNLTAGDLVHRYLWNPQQVDQLLADEQVSSLSSAGQVVWPLLNDQNSVTDLATYEEGITAVAAHRVYGAYGNTASSSGSVDCAFGYTGKYSDPLTGLQFNTDRWYNAATGRWMSKDPLGLAAGPNVYRYAGNNPSNCTDPSGLTVYTTNASAGELSGGNPISIQGAGGSYNDLVYRPGETPVSIDIGPFRPGDYGGPVASLLDYSSSDLVYHPGETPVSIGVGPFRPGDYPGQQTWSLASDEVAPPPGFHRQVFPDGTSAWIPDGAIVQYFEDGTYRIMYPNGQAVNTGKPDPNAQGFWSLWGRNIVKPWQMEDRGFRIAQYTVLIVTAASAIAAGGFAAAGYSPWLGAIQLHGAHHGLAAHIQILLRTGAHQTSTLGRIPWPW